MLEINALRMGFDMGIFGLKDYKNRKVYRKDGKYYASIKTESLIRRVSLTGRIAAVSIAELDDRQFLTEVDLQLEVAKLKGSPDYFEARL